MRRRLTTAALVCAAALAGGGRPAAAIERNFAGSAQIDYFYVPAERPTPSGGRTLFDGFTSEAALKLAVDVSDQLSANVKICYGCHGFELPLAHFDYRIADELVIRAGRFSPSFGAFNLRQDPANHATSSKPLPYDMGRMVRRTQWNLGVIPSPFPDNGVEIGGTHWFGERTALDYAVYAVSGFKAANIALDLDWTLSQTRTNYVVDNNARPSVGGRSALTRRFGEANDLTVGGSIMYGTFDPANRHYYLNAGGDFAARVGRTQLRAEYLVRHQTFTTDQPMEFVLPTPASGTDHFDKHGAYLELERAMTEAVALIGRLDGLYRVGNVAVGGPLGPRAAVYRYTAAAAFVLTRGLRLKTSVELWGFADGLTAHQDLEVGVHLGAVVTY